MNSTAAARSLFTSAAFRQRRSRPFRDFDELASPEGEGFPPSPMRTLKWKGKGRPTKLLRRDSRHQPVAVQELAHRLPASAWKTVTWRPGTKQSLRSRFAAVRVRPAHRDYERSE